MLVAISGSQGSGKAQPKGSQVLTPKGWVSIETLTTGDEVSTPDGGTGVVMGLFPQGVKQTYTVTTHDGASARACGDHLWKVFSTSGESVLTTNQIKKMIELERKLVSIPVPTALKLSTADELPIHPYLLGALIGGGRVADSRPMFTSADTKMTDEVYAMLVQGNALRNCLNLESHWGGQLQHRTIPEAYKNASIKHRLDLLRGLLHASGIIAGTSKHMMFNSPSKQLMLDVQYIVRSLGGIARLSQIHPFHYDPVIHDALMHQYVLHVETDSATLCGATSDPQMVQQRWITEIIPYAQEECFCIAIDHPDHLYITNDFIVTHNSTVLSKLADLGFKTIQRKSSRSILADWNVSLQEINSNPDLTIQFQNEIIKRKAQDEQEAVNSTELWFGERSYADLFVYSLVVLGHDNKYSNWLDEYYKACIRHQQTYAHVYYLKAGYFNVVKDGIRGDNKHYSRMVDLVMIDYTTQMTLSQQMSVIQTPDIEERVAIVSIQQSYKQGEC